IPVGRVAVNMSAGALGYPWLRFLPVSAAAALTWSAYSAGIGLLAGHWLSGQPLLSAVLGVRRARRLASAVDGVGAALRRRRAPRPPEPPAGPKTDALCGGVG